MRLLTNCLVLSLLSSLFLRRTPVRKEFCEPFSQPLTSDTGGERNRSIGDRKDHGKRYQHNASSRLSASVSIDATSDTAVSCVHDGALHQDRTFP